MSKTSFLPPLPARSPVLVQWLILGAALLLLGGAMALDLYQERERIQSREEARLLTQSRVVQENLGQALKAINSALLSLRGLVSDKPLPPAINEQLALLENAMPGVRTLNILDAAGNVRASNRPVVIGRNFRERAYFQAPLQRPDSDTLYVSPPFETALGVFAFNVVRIIPGPQGEFNGIVSATLDPLYFAPLLDSVRYAPDMWASIGHGDGVIFMMLPDRPGVTGKNIAQPGSFFTRHQQSRQEATVFSGTVYATGENRMIAQRSVRPAGLKLDKTLQVAVARDLDQIYAAWWRDLLTQGGLFGLVALASLAGLYFFQRGQRKIAQQAAAAAAALQQGAERLQLATEAAGVGVWDYDLLTGQLVWDNSMYAIYGLPPTSHPSHYEIWRAAVLPEDLPATENALQATIGQGQPFNANFRIRREDGAIRHIQALAQVYRDAAGQPVRLVGVNEDVTERRHLQSALEDSERFMKTLIDILPGMVGYWSDDLRCGFANRAYLDWFGKTEEQMHGIRIQDLMGEALFHKNEPFIRAALRGERQRFERTLVKADGSTGYTWAHYIPDFDGERVRGFFVLVSDITELKQTQIQLEKLNEQLKMRTAEAEAANHAKSEFLANMSHEIRTPMNAIIGLTHLVLENELPPQQADFLRKVLASAKSLLGIINDILDYSKIEAGHLEIERVPLRVAEILSNVAGMFSLAIEQKGLKLHLDCSPAIPAVVLGDPLRLTQVLNNLVGNAVKFTGQGEIHLGAELVQCAGATLTLRFSVRDSGIGLSPQQIEHLFQPFSQADSSTTRQYGGTGLGLVISRKLVELMGGSIDVSSTAGQGAAFTFTIQAGRATLADGAPVSLPDKRAATAHPLKGLHILLTEDNALNQEMAATLLKRRGVTVTLANHGGEAVEKVAGEIFDAVLMDLHMPVMDGIEATRRIRALPQRQALPIIAMTAAVMQEDRERCTAAGMTDFVAKPIDPDELTQTLLKWVHPANSFPGA